MINADHPGVLQHSVETFAYGEVGCTISLDGKKIAHGFGKKLGDINIYGHENPPTFNFQSASRTMRINRV